MQTSRKSHEHLDENQYNVMSKIAHDWWSPKNQMGPLQQFNEARVPFICEQLEKIGKIKDAKAPNALEGIKFLDIGCGGGILSEAIAKLHGTVVGIEPVDLVMEAAKFHASEQPVIANRITYLCETIEEHCAKHPRTYDVVIASEVIEHVADKDSFLKSASTALKDNGEIFVSCPNKTWFSLIFVHLLFTLILDVIPRHSHRFDWFIHHDALTEKMKAYNMQQKEVKGIFYIPIMIKWLVVDWPGMWYISHFTRQSSKKNL